MKPGPFIKQHYTDLEWTCIKWTLMPLVAGIAIYIVQNLSFHVIHENLCSYIDCSFVAQVPFNYLATATIVVLGVLYALELKMLWTLPILCVVCVLVFSYAESLGMKGEYGLFSLFFLAQFIAYLRHHLNSTTDLKTERIQFPLQILAAAYTLSAISKLQTSGLGWVNDNAESFGLLVFREYLSAFSTTGDIQYAISGGNISSYLLEHLWMIKIILGLSVLLEGCSFILITGKRNASRYAILLIAMHIGIYLTMNLVLYTIVVSMVALTINPIYRLVTAAKFIKGKFTP